MTKEYVRNAVASSILMTSFSVSPLSGAVVFGTSATTNFGERSGTGVTTVGATVDDSDGGSGTLDALVISTNARGTAAGQASITSPIPTVRGRSQSTGSNDVARGNAAANGAYRFDGPTAGTISFSYAFTATQSASDGAATFFRAQGALLTDVTDLYFGRSSYFEGGGILEDSFSSTFDNEDDPASISELGTLTMAVEPGQIFNVLLAVQTSAGGALANADAFSTLTGTLTSDVVGGTFTVIPEPSSLAFLALGGLVLARRRRVR